MFQEVSILLKGEVEIGLKIAEKRNLNKNLNFQWRESVLPKKNPKEGVWIFPGITQKTEGRAIGRGTQK